MQNANTQIKTSRSKLWPRKVELMQTHSKTTMATVSILHITRKPVLVATIISLMTVIFIS